MREVWVLESPDGQFIGPDLDWDGTGSFLAWPDRESAEAGREYQADINGVRDAVVKQIA